MLPMLFLSTRSKRTTLLLLAWPLHQPVKVLLKDQLIFTGQGLALLKIKPNYSLWAVFRICLMLGSLSFHKLWNRSLLTLKLVRPPRKTLSGIFKPDLLDYSNRY